MKRRFMCVGVAMGALMCPTMSWAQVGGGIKAGVNFATVSNLEVPGQSTKQRTGLVVGGFLTFGVAPMIAFEPEVLFSMQGTKLQFTDSGISSDAHAKIDYVQVPLLLRVGNSGKDVAGLYGVVGPTFGILTSAKQVVPGQPDQSFKDELKDTDVGVVAGVGVTLSRFLLEGRYTFGLRDLNKIKNPAGTNKNRVLSILVGLHF